MPNQPKPKPSTYKQHFTRSSKRNEELDRNRGEGAGLYPRVGIPSRRSSRDTLRGRRDSTVLPLSNTPLFGFEDEPEQSGTDFEAMSNSQDLHNFNMGIGDTNANMGDLPPAMETSPQGVNPNHNNLNANRNANRRDVQSQNIQAEHQTPNPQANVRQTLDPIAAHLVKELIVNVQKETLADMMKTLTEGFKETLRLEAQNIAKQVTSNVSNARTLYSGSAPTVAGDQSQFRLGYRAPSSNQNQPPQNPNVHEPNQNPFQGGPNYSRYEQPPINIYAQYPQYRQNYPQHRQNDNLQNNVNNPQRVQLDKWGIQFNGSNMPVEDFIFRVECKQSTSNYSWGEVYNHFNNLLSGPVEEWYWNFRRNSPRATYDDFKLALAERYPKKDSDIDLWRKLINRKQKLGESFDDFVDEVERIYHKMVEQPTNQQLINVIRDNVNSEISTYIGLNRTNSMVTLKHMAREAEKLATKLIPSSNRNKPYSKHLSEVSETEFCQNPEDHVFVEAFSTQKREYKVFQCKRCSQKFRVDEESKEEKRIYCYGCGKEGFIKSNCPSCSENRQNPL